MRSDDRHTGVALDPVLQPGRLLRAVFRVLHVAEVILLRSDVSGEEDDRNIVCMYLAFLVVLMNICEEIFRELESDCEKNEQRVKDLCV